MDGNNYKYDIDDLVMDNRLGPTYRNACTIIKRGKETSPTGKTDFFYWVLFEDDKTCILFECEILPYDPDVAIHWKPKKKKKLVVSAFNPGKIIKVIE